MMLALALGAALVPPLPRQPPPVDSVTAGDFDLAATTIPDRSPRAEEPLAPVPPRNLDIRDLDAPEAEWRVVDGGPVIAVGAMGGNRSGRPKLAHVALDWSFSGWMSCSEC